MSNNITNTEDQDGCVNDMCKMPDYILHYLCYLVMLVILALMYYLFYIVDNPHKSLTFTLHDVKLYAFNLSTTPSTITSTLRVNISCHNTWYRDFLELDVYASYKNQQITPPTKFYPNNNSEHEVFSPYLVGTKVRITPDVAASLAQDETAGKVLINVEVTGLLRSDFTGSGSSPPYEVNVNCPTYVMFGNKNDSDLVGSAVEIVDCHDED